MTGSVDGSVPQRTRVALDGLARLMLAEENLQSVLQRVVELVEQAMPAGSQVSLTVLRGGQVTTAAFSGQLALELDEMQQRQGYGPCLEAALGGRPVEITDGRTEERWPEYMAVFRAHGAQSALAMPVVTAQLAAGLNVYAPTVGGFTDEDRAALAEFAAYTAVALTNMDALADAREQAENLRAAMEYRGVIEQAKGILIERYKVTADQAFRLLAEASMHHNRKLRDLAQDLVLTGELKR